MDFVKSGVEGLDDVLKGGFRTNSSILLMGVPGTGKTILAIQYVHAGAQNKEPSLYITCEETPDAVHEYAKNIGYDLTRHASYVTIINQPITEKLITFGNIINLIKEKKIRRVALDSLTLFKFVLDNDINYRKEIQDFLTRMKECNVTFLAIAERTTIDIDNIHYHPEDFLFDGIILLTKIRKGSTYERCITIEKMRGQDYTLGIYPFTITNKGVQVYPKQLPFSLIEQEQ